MLDSGEASGVAMGLKTYLIDELENVDTGEEICSRVCDINDLS